MFNLSLIILLSEKNSNSVDEMFICYWKYNVNYLNINILTQDFFFKFYFKSLYIDNRNFLEKYTDK